MVKRQVSWSVMACVAWGVTFTSAALAQVQQPVHTRSDRVATRMPTSVQTGSFYTNEIRAVDQGPDDVLLEHPSNPKSMRIRYAGRALVQAAKRTGDIPTQHLFDGVVEKAAEATKAKNASQIVIEPADEVVPQAPVNEETVVEPIPDESVYKNSLPIEAKSSSGVASEEAGYVDVEVQPSYAVPVESQSYPVESHSIPVESQSHPVQSQPYPIDTGSPVGATCPSTTGTGCSS